MLLGEDDVDVREVLSEGLGQAGYRVVAVGNGAEALEQLRRGLAPRAILLDLNIPVMDGWAFLEVRNREPALQHIPVIVVSGQRNAREGVLAARASYIGKPLKIEHLLETMSSVAPTRGN